MGGKKAVWLCGLAVLYGIVMPFIFAPFRWLMDRGVGGSWLGIPTVAIELVLIIAALRPAYCLLCKIKSKAIVAIVVVILYCLIAIFWTLFLIGEIFTTH